MGRSTDGLRFDGYWDMIAVVKPEKSILDRVVDKVTEKIKGREANLVIVDEAFNIPRSLGKTAVSSSTQTQTQVTSAATKFDLRDAKVVFDNALWGSIYPGADEIQKAIHQVLEVNSIDAHFLRRKNEVERAMQLEAEKEKERIERIEKEETDAALSKLPGFGVF